MIFPPPERLRQRLIAPAKWLGLILAVASLAGSASALFLAALDWATTTRLAHPWLLAGLLVALGYPVAKYLEITANLAHGINGSSGIFFTVYYYLTFNHLVHATWGILGILWVLARLLFHGYTVEDHSGLEALASYWHATDIIWLIIFPLFYVLA